MEVQLVEKKALAEAIRETIKEAQSEIVLEAFLGRFSSVLVEPQDVAKYHKVTPQTVISYINNGLIEAEPRSKGDTYRIRLSDALRLDFKQLRKTLRRGMSN
jgi:hypothetical protein